MPPASRGLRRPWHILHFFRSYAQNHFTKKPPKRYKSSPIEGRGRRIVQKPQPQSEPSVQPIRRPNMRQRMLLSMPPIFQRIYLFFPAHIRRYIGNVIIYGPIAAMVGIHFPWVRVTVTGGSMRPFFNPNSTSEEELDTKDHMLVNTWQTSRARAGREGMTRGEIVVFQTPHDPHKIAVKRVVGLPGDKVVPLEGYEGSEEEQEDGVVVQHNHMWVEGDVNDRKKSVDSNWYGPISQNLVLGKAVVLLTPWYSPTRIRTSEHKWPAMEEGRVKINAVQEAARNPNEIAGSDWFQDDRAVDVLKAVQSDRPDLTMKARNVEQRRELSSIYALAKREVDKNDPRSVEVARELAREIEAAFYRAGGNVKNPMFPELRKTNGVLPGMFGEEEESIGPAEKALKEQLERNIKLREAGFVGDLDKPAALREARA